MSHQVLENKKPTLKFYTGFLDIFSTQLGSMDPLAFFFVDSLMIFFQKIFVNIVWKFEEKINTDVLVKINNEHGNDQLDSFIEEKNLHEENTILFSTFFIVF